MRSSGGSVSARAFATFEVSVLAFAYTAVGMILHGLSQHRASGLIGTFKHASSQPRSSDWLEKLAEDYCRNAPGPVATA